ncbi:MAG: hypothetical protein IK139_08995 [Lachnospiraceae bacterium]|nr:hypothetical protein [Lachnospiraceae bacterium]
MEENRLDEEILGYVSGGTEGDNEGAQENRKCPFCQAVLKKVGNHYECTDGCGKFDKDGNEINTYDTKRYK